MPAYEVRYPENRKLSLWATKTLTATTNSGDVIVKTGKGVRVYLDIDSINAGTLDVKLQRKDEATGQYLDLPGAAFAQKAAAGQDDLTVYPGIAETADRSVSDHIGRVFRAVATLAGGATSVVLSLGVTELQ